MLKKLKGDTATEKIVRVFIASLIIGLVFAGFPFLIGSTNGAVREDWKFWLALGAGITGGFFFLILLLSHVEEILDRRYPEMMAELYAAKAKRNKRNRE